MITKRKCPDCGGDDIKIYRTARKGKPVPYCNHCRSWIVKTKTTQ